MVRSKWTLPYGAELTEEKGRKGTLFRVAAPGKKLVELALKNGNDYQFVAMKNEGDGNFSVFIPDAGAGTRYKFRLDGEMAFPDPYTRHQPDDVHGDSMVVDPLAYEWQDQDWRGLRLCEMIIYELHVGTFTAAGTFEAIIDKLDYLTELGVNTIELLPVGDFPGRRNWGYDGVQYFAPDHVYGGPDGLKRLVDAAHQRGLAVLLDLVFNHWGPDGNYLWSYSRDHFTSRHKTPWGDAPNFDGENRHLMRTYVVQNTLYWMREYHIDGFRLDATFAIIDDSKQHILKEMVQTLQENRRANLPVTVIAEDHRNLAELHWHQPEGYGLDGQWVDDFHHTVHCYFTGERDGYYENYQGTLSELVKCFNEGFLYQGEHYKTWDEPRGTRPERLQGHEMVVHIQNHDQVGNRAFGERLNELIDRDSYHLASAIFLLSPFTPLLFMGQEYAARQPFLFFTEHNEELGRAVTKGRREEFQKFAAFADDRRRSQIPDPQDESTFLTSKLDLSEHQQAPYLYTYRLYHRLLSLIRTRPALAQRALASVHAFIPAHGIMAAIRGGDGEEFFFIANMSGQERAIELSALSAHYERAARIDWGAPLLSTLSEEFGSGGVRPVLSGEKLTLPARGLFLYLAALSP